MRNLDDDEQENKYEDDEKDKTIKKDIQQRKEEKVTGYRKYDDTFRKKQEKNSELDIEIELYLQVQVDSKLQQQLCTYVQNKDLKKQNPEIEIELKIEIPPEFDNLYLKNIDEEKQHFKKEVKKNNEFIQKKEIENNCLKEQNIEKELRRKIEELNKEINELDSDNFNELNKDNLEEFTKNNYLPKNVQFFKNLYYLFIQDLTPFYNRLDVLSNDKTQTNVQKKLNEEFLKKLDSFLQLKYNKENREGHQQQVDSKIILIDNQDVKVVGENKRFELKDELKRAVGLRVNHEIKNNCKIKEKESQQNYLRETQEGVNRDERIRNQFEEIDKKDKCQHYDLVIQYNHEMSQELNGHSQPVLGKQMFVEFFGDAVKAYLNKSDKDALKKKLSKTETDVINQNKNNKNIQFQLEFYKNVQVEEDLQKKNEQLQNYTEEEINEDFKVKTKENETEVQEDSDEGVEEFEEEMREHFVVANDEHFEEIHENSKFKIGALERTIIVESEVKIEDSENELQEDSDSDVDVEGFEGEILEFPEVKIEDFYVESEENTDLDTENLSEEEFNDINEVIEIVEDIKVESYYSDDDYIPSDKIPTSACDELNLKMGPNSKLTHDGEEKLKISSDPTIFTEHIKEKQIFSELKHQLDELSQEYKGYVQTKVFKELQQEIDDKQLQEMEIFPETFNEVNLKTNEDFQKEIDELQNEWCQLKPEFMSDLPLNFEDNKSSKKLKKKPFNLFDKLYSIHKKLLRKISESKEWPEKVNK